MAENSKIEWTDHTFNPWVGCTKVSPACDHCYAESWAKRAGYPELWQGERRRTREENWRKPIHWHSSIPDGERQRVFCASLADVFDNAVPDEWRFDLFDLIRKTPRLDWLLLTKRIGNAKGMLQRYAMDGAYNVWVGATVVTREEFDRDVDKLRRTPARVRFLSMEPLLEPMGDIDLTGIDWVIVGGESGGKARPMESAWAEHIRYRCESYGAAFFFKQGSSANWPSFKNFDSFPSYLQRREWPRTASS